MSFRKFNRFLKKRVLSALKKKIIIGRVGDLVLMKRG
jgi:hypothetical protein